ncbi:glycine oxidase ThiO [Bacillus sp. PS06]|uniref:glycine oxidase ThiO n=1 Tax=Bacillus sp. PS06 TaxID=2764176 RepID=UPI00177CCDB7|nr:glycine oxidase ThiO [Bacillus sp. PS06]MBD8067756.1 glycine oxidase ThiO [Bacillus sp. PS06]
MSAFFDCIVIGGGVNGGSIAYNLAKRGKHVLLVEKDRLVSKASNAAAGMLAAGGEFEEVGPLFELARRSRSMFPRIAEELKELSHIDIELINKGMFKIAMTDEEVLEYSRVLEFQHKEGEEISWISPNELMIQESKLSSDIKGALYLPQDGHVSAPELALGYLKSAAKLGATIKEFVEVTSLIIEGGMTKGVVTSEGPFYSDQVILAGGAWSAKVLEQSSKRIETYPVKGECFSVTTHLPLITKTIFSHGCYLVPKKGGRIIVGATEKPNTFSQSVSIKGISTLMERAIRILPSLEEAEWEKSWAGIRPQTSDGLPYLGEHPEYQDLFIATGHYRNGILLAPITGEIIANLIEGRQEIIDLSPFKIDRHFVESTEKRETTWS